MDQQDQHNIRIGELAKRYGVSAESIRNWERQGLIPPATRTPGGHRRYTDNHRRALDAIIIPVIGSMIISEPAC